MVTNNKVLTVSYGTFSCTLEGFEESFDTMKAIAEYFRDLAGDDRYFGAEPPTPDAEMLARIAEREIERRVSARMDSGAIVLSAMPGAAAQSTEDKTPPPEKAQEIAKTTEAPAEGVSDEAELVAETIVAPEQDEPVSVSEEAENASTPEDETVDLTAVEDAVSDASSDVEPSEQVAPEITKDEMPETEVSSEDLAEEIAADVVEPEAETAELEKPVSQEVEILEDVSAIVDEEASDIVSEPEVVSNEAPSDAPLDNHIEDADEPFVLNETDAGEDSFFDDFPEALSDEDELQDDETTASDDFGFSDWEEPKQDVPPQFEENSIAAKLERIRAVVARVEAQPEEDDFSEDEHAEAVEPQADSNEKTLERIEATLAEEHSERETPQDDFPVESLVEDIAQDDQDDALEQAETPTPLRARVVRMKKADFEQAVSSGLLEAEPVEDEEDDVELTDSGLTAEDEADLMAELAEVEAELAPESLELEEDEAEVSETPVEEVAIEDPTEMSEAELALDDIESGVKVLADQPSGDKDISRLMNKADSEMEEPEGNRRRRAIAHLRAAVAATRAEKEAGQDLGPKDDTTAYRDDLASVVRPVPGGKTEASEKSERPAPAPLKLVAEQRIDTPVEEAPQPQETASPASAVRPRRVSADQIDRVEVARAATPVGSNAAIQSDFLEFAGNVGATRLPDTLEAAASYLTYVQGMDRFSRAMLVRLARECNEAEFTREDGLRSFGQLLRSGKIKKVAGGKFTADSSIGFRRDEDRAVG